MLAAPAEEECTVPSPRALRASAREAASATAASAPAPAAASTPSPRDATPQHAMGPEGKTVFAFGSSGWLFCYYLGVVKALKAAGLHKNAYLIASSGGAIAGCALFYDVDLDEMVEYVCGCAVEARSTRSGPFRLREYIAGAIERFADPERTPALLHGNMEVSVTVLPTCRNARITDFATWDSMRTHLLATACIVPLAGLPMWVPGLGLVLDGGLSDLQLVRGWRRSGSFSAVHDGWGPAAAACPGSPTVHVTACPFYMSRAAIKPDKVVPPYWAFYPPEPQQLRELYAMGQRNAGAWVAARGQAEAAAACAPCPAKTPRAPAVPPSPVRAWRCAEEYAAAARAAAAGAAHGAAAKAEGAAASASALAASVAADAQRFAAECSSALQVQRSWLCGVRERSLKTLACALVYAELCCQATVSTCAAALPPALNGRVSRRRAWERAKSFVAPLPGLAQLALSPPRSSSAARLLATHAVVLTQLSLLYRLLHHAIL